MKTPDPQLRDLLETVRSLGPVARQRWLRDLAARDLAMSQRLVAALAAEANDTLSRATRESPDPPDETSAAAAGKRGPDASDLGGRMLGNKYRIVRLLGKGGFGFVYEGIDDMLGAPVAIKVLKPEAAAQPEALSQFLGEARLLTTLDHANIVRWITFDRTPDGLSYFVMEFLRGKELSDVLDDRGRLPPKQAITILRQMLSALCAAHFLPDGRALLHLDLKPRNVFVLPGDDLPIKVIDFGISQHVGAAARAAAVAADPAVVAAPVEENPEATIATIATPATRPHGGSGQSVQRARGGTPLYASPEHCRHLRNDVQIVELDGRSDLYSLGLIGFEMLAGRLPWECRTIKDCYEAHLGKPVPSLSSLGVKAPPKLERFLRKCLEKDRDRRFRDVREALEALELIANPKRPVAAIAAAFAPAFLLAAWFLWPAAPVQAAELRPDGPDAHTLYLGSARTVLSVPIRDLLPRQSPPPLRWVNDRVKREAALAGWQARLSDDGSAVEVRAPNDCPLTDQKGVFLQIGDGDRAQFSQELRVVYLPLGDWSLAKANVGVPETRDRIVDPVGARIRLELPSDPAWIDRVELSLADEPPLLATLDRVRSKGNSAVYELGFDAFETVPRDRLVTVAIDVRVHDKAGNQRACTASWRVDARPLRCTPKLEGGASGAAVPVIYPGARPLLDPVLPLDWVKSVKVTDATGARDDVSVDRAEGGFRLAFPPTAGASYDGFVVVEANDEEQVYHADRSRGVATARLAFRFEKDQPTISVLTSDRLELPEALATRASTLRLSIERGNLVEQDVIVSRARGGRTEQRIDLELHTKRSEPATIELPEDDEYLLTVASWRHFRDAAARTAAERGEPDCRKQFRIRRDTVAPSLSWSLAPADITARTKPNDTVGEIQIDGSDDRTRLTWRITGPLPAGQADRGSQAPTRADAATLTWPALGLDPDTLPDGSYEIEVGATDAADNVSVPVRRAFVVAREGPNLVLISPREAWVQDGDGRFAFVARATDGNGVASVEIGMRLAAAAAAETRWLRLQQSTDDPDRWQTQQFLDGSWSSADVQLMLRGTDARGLGNETQPIRKTLPPFSVPLPAIRYETAPRFEGRMIAVVGTKSYWFRGRSRAEEERTLRAAGIDRLDNLGLEPTQLPVDDYYLDANEVTVAEFAAFVVAADGYAAPANWVAEAPAVARGRELADALQQRVQAGSGGVPVTGVTPGECAAYAAWVGKRLPTLLEWEYAVRGGATDYRAYSLGNARPPGDFAISKTQPLPVEQGPDEVERGIGAGLRNLCSNVAEWVVCRDGTVVAAGGCFVERFYDFTFVTKTKQPRGYIGFRCALDAETVLKALQPGATNSRIRLAEDTSDQPRKE